MQIVGFPRKSWISSKKTTHQFCTMEPWNHGLNQRQNCNLARGDGAMLSSWLRNVSVAARCCQICLTWDRNITEYLNQAISRWLKAPRKYHEISSWLAIKERATVRDCIRPEFGVYLILPISVFFCKLCVSPQYRNSQSLIYSSWLHISHFSIFLRIIAAHIPLNINHFIQFV